MEAVIFLVLGLVGVTVGAGFFVRGSSDLAQRFGLPPVVIGLTVVAVGTSAPELAVTLDSVLTGREDIGVGNIVGSNISNLLLILGVAALITPFAIDRRLLRVDVPLLVAVSLLLFALALDLLISRFDSLVLLGLLAAYAYWLLRGMREEDDQDSPASRASHSPPEPKIRSTAGFVRSSALLLLGGLGLLVAGSHGVVSGASDLARLLGATELVIGLTIVAIGTSLPELATSVTAAFRGEQGIAIGNVIGSNLLNMLLVLGLTALAAPRGIPVALSALTLDIPVMIFVTVICVAFFLSGRRVSRFEGALLLGSYLCYVGYLLGAGAATS